MPRYPTLAVLSFTGACALLLTRAGHAGDAPPAAAVPAPANPALDEIEAQAPREWKDPAAIAASHARVISLVEADTLQSGRDYHRAAGLLRFHLNEYRILRMQYELTLAAAAKDDPAAEKELAMAWDQFMGRIGRPARFDFFGWAQKNTEYADYEPAPACIQAVWRDPAAARAALAGMTDNPEIKIIVEADQADRKGNWATRTAEEREASMSRDKARNARMREILAAGDIRTAADFSRAALVMQHSARYAGFRLAHELAVASLLLGDRQTGRWLVAAAYDRMLLSVGLDQRFGTQYGPAGPLVLDESGICDNQRLALGCPTLAQARARQAQGSRVIGRQTQEMLKPGNVIHDAAAGVTATYPQGWTVSGVNPAGDNATSIQIDRAGDAPASFSFYYRLLDAPQPTARDAAAALLRKQAADKQTDRRRRAPDYANRPGSDTFREIGEQPSLSWIADYERDGAKWSEYLVRILGKNSVALLFLDAPADRIESLKSAVDAMAETVQLP